MRVYRPSAIWLTRLPDIAYRICGFLKSRRSLAAAFDQKHMEVRGKRLGVKLAHHQRDLTSMVSGMVRQMLHEVGQTDLRCAKREHSFQGFVCQAIHELDQFLLNFSPL
jgi:hypothetical protein